MKGEGGSVDDRTVAEVVEGLRSMIGAIDDGRMEATEDQRAYLGGAADALTLVSERSL